MLPPGFEPGWPAFFGAFFGKHFFGVKHFLFKKGLLERPE